MGSDAHIARPLGVRGKSFVRVAGLRQGDREETRSADQEWPRDSIRVAADLKCPADDQGYGGNAEDDVAVPRSSTLLRYRSHASTDAGGGTTSTGTRGLAI